MDPGHLLAPEPTLFGEPGGNAGAHEENCITGNLHVRHIEYSRLDALPKHLLEDFLVALSLLGDAAEILGTQETQFTVTDKCLRLMICVKRDMETDGRNQFFLGGLPMGHTFLETLNQLVHDPIKHVEKQILFALEMVVQAARFDVQVLGDGADRSCRISLFVKKVNGHLADLLAARSLFFCCPR